MTTTLVFASASEAVGLFCLVSLFIYFVFHSKRKVKEENVGGRVFKNSTHYCSSTCHDRDGVNEDGTAVQTCFFILCMCVVCSVQLYSICL